MFGNPMEILIIAGAAILLFGADKVPKLARGLGQAKKEFMAAQAEPPGHTEAGASESAKEKPPESSTP